MIQLPEKSFKISPRARAKADLLSVDISEVRGSGPFGRIIEQDIMSFNDKNVTKNKDENFELSTRKITPLAKRILEVEDVNIDHIHGTGFSGKITSSDVLTYIEAGKQTSEDVIVKKPLAGIRKTIASRMSFSKREAPHVTLTVKIEATEFVNYRKSLIERLDIKTKIGFTDLLIKIVSTCLEENRGINVSLINNEIVYYSDINIGVAVALKEGLIVPVVHNANDKSIMEISLESKEKFSRAKKGNIRPIDVERGTFTISNLGMYEVDGFTPIINPPESAILGVGRIKEDIIVENQAIRIGKTMILSLSFDHRVIDGAPAAIFLERVKYMIENPSEIESTDK